MEREKMKRKKWREKVKRKEKEKSSKCKGRMEELRNCSLLMECKVQGLYFNCLESHHYHHPTRQEQVSHPNQFFAISSFLPILLSFLSFFFFCKINYSNEILDEWLFSLLVSRQKFIAPRHIHSELLFYCFAMYCTVLYFSFSSHLNSQIFCN